MTCAKNVPQDKVQLIFHLDEAMLQMAWDLSYKIPRLYEALLHSMRRFEQRNRRSLISKGRRRPRTANLFSLAKTEFNPMQLHCDREGVSSSRHRYLKVSTIP